MTIDLAMIRQAFEEDNPFWTVYIALLLEKTHAGLSIEWGMRCVARLLPQSGSPNLAQLQTDFDSLMAVVRADLLPVPYGNERVREIWYYPDNHGNGAQRAISNLYAAYHLYKCGRQDYKQVVGSPIPCFLYDTDWNQRPHEVFEIVMEIAHVLLTERGKPAL